MNLSYFDYESRSVISLNPVEDRIAWIVRVNTPEGWRGKGRANRLMNEVIYDADIEEITLKLHIVSSGPLRRFDLERWYGKFGFEPIYTKDYGEHMVRKPNNQMMLRGLV